MSGSSTLSRKCVLRVRDACICQPWGQSPSPASFAGVGRAPCRMELQVGQSCHPSAAKRSRAAAASRRQSASPPRSSSAARHLRAKSSARASITGSASAQAAQYAAGAVRRAFRGGLRAPQAGWRRPKPEASAGRRSLPCRLHHVLERILPTRRGAACGAHDSPEVLRTWRKEANCTASPAARANAAGTGAPPTCAPPPTGARSLGVRWECPGQRLLFRPAACCLARLLRPALR